MPPEMQQLIDDIIREHGLKLSRDDPVLMLATVNKRLALDMQKRQEKMLAEFKSEMELFGSRCAQDAKETANTLLKNAAKQSERIINQTLTDSKARLQEAIEQTVKAQVKVQTGGVQKTLTPALEQAKQAAYLSLAAASAAIFAACLALWAAW